MTVTSVEKDLDALTLTLTAQFDAPVERTWLLWADPRQLERWWGPPTYPATFVEHQLSPGSLVTYFMTAPDGTRYHGWWRVREVEAPVALEVEDGFGDSEGRPDPTMPTSVMQVRLTATDDGGTRVTIHSTFPSLDAMQRQLDMGMEEGLTLAVGQADAVLAGTPA